MKMFIEPISKEALDTYLAITDLTQSAQPHAIKIVYEKIVAYMRSTHPQSDVQVYRKDPIVTARDNFDNLLIASDNMSRSSTYTHYVDKTHVLRTHTSAHVPGIVRERAQRVDWEDVVILLPGITYRRDVSDKKHVSEVHMLEMWRVVKHAARRPIIKDDLLTVVKGVASTAAPNWNLRIVDSPHPYTKRGMEVNAVKDDRDIEILECGLIRDEILARAGLDPCAGYLEYPFRKGAMYILKHVLNSLKHLVTLDFQWLHSHLTRWTKPLNCSLVLGTVGDLFRSKSQLVAENALLRQQLIILRRQVKRPGCTKTERWLQRPSS